MINPTMDISKEELDTVLKGIEDSGSISEEAEKIFLARINEGKERGLPIFEVKRQFRAHLDAGDGVKVAKAIDQLW